MFKPHLRREWLLPSLLSLMVLQAIAFSEDSWIRPRLRSPKEVFRGQGPEGTNPNPGAMPSGGTPSGSGFDPALVSQGQAAFDASCTTCHDRERSFQKVKSLAGWRSTVRRMAEKDGADIPGNTWEAIATYLASQGGGAAGGNADSSAPDSPLDSLTFSATVSPTWRGGNDVIQNTGFVPDVWIGANWQPSNSPISARVTACFSCHNEPGLGSRIELVEAALRLDILAAKDKCGCERKMTLGIEAGRFIVPFGNFSSQVNPGVYRTVTKPLMYNMGMRVYDEDLGDPVLPMPFSDEGIKLDGVYTFNDDWNMTYDFYAINGLQGGDDGIDFDMSREYVDNNRLPSYGARTTFGNNNVRIGTSYVAGFFNDDGGGALGQRMNYQIFGADLAGRLGDRLRYVVEYAQRDTDRVVALPGEPMATEKTDGLYAQAEYMLFPEKKISVIGRYDVQRKRSPLPPPGSALTTGNFSVQRFTYGANFVMPGGSLLMVNHEHWFLSDGFPDIDVLGARWALSF